jgi:hypothetical protein
MVAIPGDLGHMFAAGVPVDQVEDECPHDRTPLLINAFNYQGHVSGPLRMIMETVSSADKMVSAEVGRAIVSAWPFQQDDKTSL